MFYILFLLILGASNAALREIYTEAILQTEELILQQSTDKHFTTPTEDRIKKNLAKAWASIAKDPLEARHILENNDADWKREGVDPFPLQRRQHANLETTSPEKMQKIYAECLIEMHLIHENMYTTMMTDFSKREDLLPLYKEALSQTYHITHSRLMHKRRRCAIQENLDKAWENLFSHPKKADFWLRKNAPLWRKEACAVQLEGNLV